MHKAQVKDLNILPLKTPVEFKEFSDAVKPPLELKAAIDAINSSAELRDLPESLKSAFRRYSKVDPSKSLTKW